MKMYVIEYVDGSFSHAFTVSAMLAETQTTEKEILRITYGGMDIFRSEKVTTIHINP